MYYKCVKCETNYVASENATCRLCQEEYTDYGCCAICGAPCIPSKDICPICSESLALLRHKKNQTSDITFGA